MQIKSRIEVSKPESEFDKNLLDELTRYCRDLARILNSGIKFEENFNCEIISYTSNSTANAEDTIPHSLGRIPTGYFILHRSKAGIVYQGPATGTPWTDTNIYLKCTVASTQFKLLVV